MFNRARNRRKIAREFGRAPSTVANEVERHRFVTSPQARYGEPAPAAEELAAACPRLGSWPRCCNGCGHRRAYGCSKRPRVFYGAQATQCAADEELCESRRGGRRPARGSRAAFEVLPEDERRDVGVDVFDNV